MWYNLINTRYIDQDEFNNYYFTLKQSACPHCKKTGYLNRHSFVYRYTEKQDSSRNQIKGQRVFCNNRHKKKGCGKTYIIMLSHFIKGYMLSSATIWSFLEFLEMTLNKKSAFSLTKSHFSQSTVYRIYKKVCFIQVRLRTYLSRICKPPDLAFRYNPIHKTIAHLRLAFSTSSCPITSFQKHFQVSFF